MQVGNTIRKLISNGAKPRQGSSLQPGGALHSCLEQPVSGDSFSEFIAIKGWALSTQHHSKLKAKIVIMPGLRSVDVAQSFPVKLSINRPDVTATYGCEDAELQCGFATEIPWKALGKDVEGARVFLNVSDGVHTTGTGPVAVIKKADKVEASRGDYASVWNSAVEDHSTAMLAVAGFDNHQEFLDSGISTADTLCLRLGITKNDTVLEIGCGTARIGASLAPRCKKWIGTDISKKMLEYAAQNMKGQDNFELHELTGCNLSQFADESLDKIYCAAVFMHLDEWDRYRYVTEAFRVLRPGGRAYFDNMDIESPEVWPLFLELSKLDPSRRPANISKTSSEPELRTYLERAGFTMIQSTKSGRLVELVGDKPAA